jgi:hypothetical protein
MAANRDFGGEGEGSGDRRNSREKEPAREGGNQQRGENSRIGMENE